MTRSEYLKILLTVKVVIYEHFMAFLHCAGVPSLQGNCPLKFAKLYV